ncbi:hypothetical protein [Parasediminibacterium sp. JCM 36343]|uniref:hypothetical protein n=1 Tax=Parasediminibacterium sp. JCM 36343 TaxID=3374279 RepID=UPI00397E0F78
MRYFKKSITLLAVIASSVITNQLSAQIKGAGDVLLNGQWQMGFARNYTSTVAVPGIATDPTKMNNDELWYKREIKLPEGNWAVATLELKGARFQPTVYINGDIMGKQEGGMAPIFFILHHDAIKPGNTITMEISLASLKNMHPTDASYIPGSDHWRTNVGSSLWDDVVLHLHGAVSINRIIPFNDLQNKKANIQFDLDDATGFKGKATVEITDAKGKLLLAKTKAVAGKHDNVEFSTEGKIKNWSPDEPNLYHLKLSIIDDKGKLADQSTIAYGFKSLEIKDKQFYLNGQHFVAKGPTVVWHRWMRAKEGRELGYDTTWFVKNIIQRTKDLGGNYLRYHLGLPPERLLDLCDHYGLAVQFEWSFFHGMPATKESLLIQYKSWLNLAMRHPCVSFIHPYNETGGEQLKTAWTALDELLLAYPPLVLEDRDVIHVHKYWWSLFENLGLYYDNANIFPKVIMADEFGGDYLDQKGNVGSYPASKETYLRFLGRTHTPEHNLAFQAEANGKIAEYWRRIGAAGFSPFCALASDEDGNNWFLGPLKEGKPKPVWDALAVAFSPQAASLELWDRDFVPSQQVTVPVYVFNDYSIGADLSVKVTIEDKAGKIVSSKDFTVKVAGQSKLIEQVSLSMPTDIGDYTMKAELLNKPLAVKYPVVSAWDFRVLKANVPATVQQLKVGVPDNETELKDFLKENNIAAVDFNDASANVLLTSLKTWNKLAKGDSKLSDKLQSAINEGKSVVMLDIGDRQLGQGYPDKPGNLGPLQGVMRLTNPGSNTYNLFGGISLTFTETAEPESHIHPDRANRELWGNRPDNYAWLWNGYRGGLIVPAADMAFSGLSSKAFVAQWKAHGADEQKITNGAYYAYELQGFYAFSDSQNDKVTEMKLKEKVYNLVQDAPALANSINPNSPVTVTDLNKGYKDAAKGIAENLVPLANCAKNLTQTPIALVSFGQGKGSLIVSQLLTAGRLAKGYGQPGLYGIRYDETTVQYVLNMIALAAKK